METSSTRRAAALNLFAWRASRTDTLVAAGIIVLFWVIYAVSPVTTSTDSAWTFHVAASILQEHNINLDEYRGLMNLPVEVFEHKQVQDWLKSNVIEHYFDHAV